MYSCAGAISRYVRGVARGTIVLVVLLAVMSAESTAIEAVVTVEGALAPETQFLRELAEKRELQCKGPDSTDAFMARQCAVLLSVGRRDLNGDDSYELFVYYAQFASCGSLGCDLDIFRNRDGHWLPLTGGSAHGSVDVIKDGGSEWPLLIFNNYSGRVWKETDSGGRYVRFCVSDECRHDLGG